MIQLNGVSNNSFSSGVIFPKESNIGVKVDTGSPTFPFQDLKGIMFVDITGANAPTVEIYKTGVEDYAYNGTDKQRYKFHIEHWNMIGGDKFLHAHIRHNGTSITGDMVLTFVITYNYGHNRASSPSPITKTLTVLSANIATTMPRYETYIADILVAQSGGGAGLFDSDLWLPDDDILVTMTVTTLPTITGGTTGKIFIPHVDLHLQSTEVGTKSKSPNFFV